VTLVEIAVREYGRQPLLQHEAFVLEEKKLAA
jgi:hypothetical protein